MDALQFPGKTSLCRKNKSGGGKDEGRRKEKGKEDWKMSKKPIGFRVGEIFFAGEKMSWFAHSHSINLFCHKTATYY